MVFSFSFPHVLVLQVFLKASFFALVLVYKAVPYTVGHDKVAPCTEELYMAEPCKVGLYI